MNLVTKYIVTPIICVAFIMVFMTNVHADHNPRPDDNQSDNAHTSVVEPTLPTADYSSLYRKLDGARAMGLAASLINPTFHHQKYQSGVAAAVSGDVVALAVGLTVKLAKSTSVSFAIATDTYDYTAGTAMNWFW